MQCRQHHYTPNYCDSKTRVMEVCFILRTLVCQQLSTDALRTKGVKRRSHACNCIILYPISISIKHKHAKSFHICSIRVILTLYYINKFWTAIIL